MSSNLPNVPLAKGMVGGGSGADSHNHTVLSQYGLQNMQIRTINIIIGNPFSFISIY